MLLFSKIHSSYPRNEPCPCESGKKAKYCCLINNQWIKQPADINPKAPKTNFENKKCYASVTQDCASEITREHFISHSVLKQISKGGKRVRASGLSWMPNKEAQSVGTKSLVASNLCSRHNQALSPLDAAAARLFKTFDSYDNGFKELNPKEEIRVFCGEDLERWMLKSAIGVLESGQLKNDDQPLKLKLHENLIKILYGQYKWPKGWGMHISEETITYLPSVGCLPIIENNKLIGMRFRINNFVFNLAFELFEDNHKVYGVYRPKTLILTDNKSKKYIELCWQNKNNNLIVELVKSKKSN